MAARRTALPSRSMSACDMLFMSSEVQAKWMNSERLSSEVPFTLSLRKYSTALTSWFVVRSISFTRTASSTEKDEAIARSALRSAADSALHSRISFAPHSASSQVHSTSTRRRTRPYSENTSRSSAHFVA